MQRLNADIAVPLPDTKTRSSTDKNASRVASASTEEESAPPYNDIPLVPTTHVVDQIPIVPERSPFANDVANEAAQQKSEEQNMARPSDNGDLVPPSAALLRPRIDSTPPKLPELNVYQRTFSPTPFPATFERATSPNAERVYQPTVPTQHVPSALIDATAAAAAAAGWRYVVGWAA